MISCSRIIEFDAAHRIIDHKSKCRFLHGHRYSLEVEIASKFLDDMGFVMDFGDIKKIVKSWVDHNLDHNVILNKKDKVLGDLISSHTGQTVYYLDNNPSAENIALHLMRNIMPNLFKDFEYINIISLKLCETPNCFVSVSSIENDIYAK